MNKDITSNANLGVNPAITQHHAVLNPKPIPDKPERELIPFEAILLEDLKTIYNNGTSDIQQVRDFIGQLKGFRDAINNNSSAKENVVDLPISALFFFISKCSIAELKETLKFEEFYSSVEPISPNKDRWQLAKRHIAKYCTANNISNPLEEPRQKSNLFILPTSNFNVIAEEDIVSAELIADNQSLEDAKNTVFDCASLFDSLGVKKFSAGLKQAGEQLCIDPIMIWAYDLAATMSLLSSEAHIDIKGRKEPSIIYSAVVARSGEGKSRAEGLVWSYIKTLDKKARENFDSRYKQWEIDSASAMKNNEEFDEPEPILEQYYSEVGTIEGVQKRLFNRTRGYVWCRDELKGIFSSLNQHSKSDSEAGEIILKLWGGDCVSVDRVKRSDSYHIPSTRMSMVGGIQPGVLSKIFTDPDDSQGLSARFLFHVSQTVPYEYKLSYIDLSEFYPDYYEWLLTLNDKKEFSLSPDALEDYARLCTELFNEGRKYDDKNEALAAWYKKAPAHILRLALPIHLHRCYELNPYGNVTAIDKTTLNMAHVFLLHNAEAFKVVHSEIDKTADATLMSKIQAKSLKRNGT